jgi:hypothetical protein
MAVHLDKKEGFLAVAQKFAALRPRILGAFSRGAKRKADDENLPSREDLILRATLGAMQGSQLQPGDPGFHTEPVPLSNPFEGVPIGKGFDALRERVMRALLSPAVITPARNRAQASSRRQRKRQTRKRHQQAVKRRTRALRVHTSNNSRKGDFFDRWVEWFRKRELERAAARLQRARHEFYQGDLVYFTDPSTGRARRSTEAVTPGSGFATLNGPGLFADSHLTFTGIQRQKEALGVVIVEEAAHMSEQVLREVVEPVLHGQIYEDAPITPGDPWEKVEMATGSNLYHDPNP